MGQEDVCVCVDALRLPLWHQRCSHESAELSRAWPCNKTSSQNTVLKKRSLSIEFCASLHRSADANADILKFAGRRPAMKRHHGSAILEKIMNCVLTSSDSRHDAEDAKIKESYVHVSWASPWNETNSLFRYAGE